MVVVAGGDGTINEALQGMAGSTVPLAILPAGTANVLASEMGLPGRIEAAARRLAECIPCRISAGRVSALDAPARWFLLMAGAGLDARVVYRVSAPLKARLGKIAYWIAAFGMAGETLDEFEARVEGRSLLCSFALVSKVRNYGGDLEIARDTSLLDDRFEVVLFSGRSALRYVKYLGAVALKRVSGVGGVTVLRARRVALSAAADRRIYVQVDGEFAGRLPASIELVPDALTLLVPPDYVRRVRASVNPPPSPASGSSDR
jgi:diacylglycerol kinase (ATP)